MTPDKPAAGKAEPEIYSVAARRFHWWTVLLILIQLPLGIAMTNYAERTNFASPSGQLYDAHKLIGMSILILVVARLWYRIAKGAPTDEPSLEPWQRLVSHVTHWAIYALLLIVPMIGWLAVSAYGPFQPFDIPLPRLIAQNDALAERLFGLHKLVAIVLLLLVGMHIGAALFHYFIRKDGVLNRMWARLPRR